MLGVVPIAYSFYAMDETLESVQKNKNGAQAKRYDLIT